MGRARMARLMALGWVELLSVPASPQQSLRSIVGAVRGPPACRSRALRMKCSGRVKPLI